MPTNDKLTKGRGAQYQPHNKFEKNAHEWEADYLEFARLEGENIESTKTKYINVHPKTIVNPVNSPDVPFKWSINPYQGCEHGCVYCYARNTHEYWGYSAGKDFEKTILVKQKAAQLLTAELSKKKWKPSMIMLSGNTDCYQPIERKLKLTRALLQVMNECNHPVGVITKNALILRDLDILKELNKKNLLRITLSITTLDDKLRRTLEPRTSSVDKRLKTLKVLTENGIFVNVNMAPIIPGLNSHEIIKMAEEIGARGAYKLSYIMVRLNGHIGDIFTDWIHKAYPEKAEKVLHLIKETHHGNLNDSRWKTRISGSGNIALQIKNLVSLANRKYLKQINPVPLNTDQFVRPRKDGQTQLF